MTRNESTSEHQSAGSSPERGPTNPWTRWIVLLVLVACAATLFVTLREELSLDHLARQEVSLRQFQQEHPLLVYGAAFCLYVSVTGLSLPGAAGLTLLFGWYFGLLRGVVLVSFASTTGATAAFLLSRYLFRDIVSARFGDTLARFNAALDREGAFYLFTLRLIAGVPFFLINLVMGITGIGIGTFWWVSQLGMLPGTFLYTYAGASVPDLQTLADEGIGAVFSPSQLAQILVALALLGLFPLAAKKLTERIRRPDTGRPNA